MYLWIIRYEGPSSLPNSRYPLNELFSFGDGYTFSSKPNCTRSISILGLFIV